jgi:hypothetical protein
MEHIRFSVFVPTTPPYKPHVEYFEIIKPEAPDCYVDAVVAPPVIIAGVVKRAIENVFIR